MRSRSPILAVLAALAACTVAVSLRDSPGSSACIVACGQGAASAAGFVASSAAGERRLHWGE